VLMQAIFVKFFKNFKNGRFSSVERCVARLARMMKIGLQRMAALQAFSRMWDITTPPLRI